MLDSILMIIGNLTSTSDDKNKTLEGLRRDLFKRDIFALGANVIEIIERIIQNEQGKFNLDLIATIAWSFAHMT